MRKVELADSEILWNKLFIDYQNYKFYEHNEIKSYEDFKQLVVNQIKRYDDGNYYRWAIIKKDANELIGNINLHQFDMINNITKFGYYILEEFRNQGYATEGVLKVIDFVFNTLKVNRIEATTISGNEFSNRMLLKAEFILEGIKKKSHKIDGKYYDSNIFGLLNPLKDEDI